MRHHKRLLFNNNLQCFRMWQAQVISVCILVAASAQGRQISDEGGSNEDKYLKEKTDLELDENDDKHEFKDGRKLYNIEEDFGIKENDLDDESDDDDIGEIVPNDGGGLPDFPSHLVDASDMPTIDGRTCFTAWDNLKMVEPEIQMIMTQDPATNPHKCLDENNDATAGNQNPKIITGSSTESSNYTTVKTHCYRSLHPEKKCSPGEEDCPSSGAGAGYCDCGLYTVWRGQRFCCPQCACHATLVAQDNLFKCSCVFNALIEPEYM